MIRLKTPQGLSILASRKIFSLMIIQGSVYPGWMVFRNKLGWVFGKIVKGMLRKTAENPLKRPLERLLERSLKDDGYNTSDM